MNEKQAKALAMLTVDQIIEPARRLLGALEAARVALEMDEPDVAQKCCQRMSAAIADLQTVAGDIQALASSQGIGPPEDVRE